MTRMTLDSDMNLPNATFIIALVLGVLLVGEFLEELRILLPDGVRPVLILLKQMRQRVHATGMVETPQKLSTPNPVLRPD